MVDWCAGLWSHAKENYFSSAFGHCVNVFYAWTALIRDVVRDHSSILVTGRDSHMLIAVDEYVESRLVKPLKMYATGHRHATFWRQFKKSAQRS